MTKVLEKLIYSRVYNFLESNGTPYKSQCGFRTKCSCEQAITELLGHLLQAKELGQTSASIFLDLSKAFDTLNHGVLMKKLEWYGICGIPNVWFESYLDNRLLKAQKAASPNKFVYSDKYPVTYGTAQGSCLGPLLFVIFCNDIHLLPIYGKLSIVI